MKILQVHSFFYPHIGGSENYVLELSKQLKRKGHEVVIVTSKLKGDKEFENIEGMDVFRVPGIYLPNVPYFVFSPKLFNVLLNWARGFDIVHSHVRFFFSTNCVALFRRIWKNTRFVVTSHTTRPETQIHCLRHVRGLYEYTAGRFTVNSADIVIALDENIRNNLISYGAKPEKIRIIPNGVDTERFFPTKRKKGQIVIGYIGRLVKGKGVNYLIQAFKSIAKIYDVKLNIVGDGAERTVFENMCKTPCLQGKIEFWGALDPKQIPDFFNLIDILVLPSLSEGMPTVVLEAMACGKAVIATDVGATSTLINSEEVGILVQPASHSAISKALEHLILDDELRIQIGKNARKRIEQFYSWQVIADYIEKAYAEAMRM